MYASRSRHVLYGFGMLNKGAADSLWSRFAETRVPFLTAPRYTSRTASDAAARHLCAPERPNQCAAGRAHGRWRTALRQGRPSSAGLG